MAGVFDDMVAIAAGTATQVDSWAAILRSALIQYTVASSTQVSATNGPKHVELWVHKKDAERARTLLQESSPGNGAFLW